MTQKEGDKDFSKDSFKPMINEMRSAPWKMIKIFAPAMMMYLGTGLIVLNLLRPEINLSQYFNKYQYAILGAFLILLSTTLLSKQLKLKFKERQFIDIDSKNSKEAAESHILRQVLSDLQVLKNKKVDVDIDQLTQIIQDSQLRIADGMKEKFESFISYFETISSLLERKAEVADKKASILLDRGIIYTKFGIVFFIISIIVWQLLSWAKGFQTQFIYGIASCSILFVFIEFLSGWFLKQYRNFINTSMYLIKVKSIFDRYLLAFFAIKEFPSDTQSGHSQSDRILHLLAEDIKWPDKYIFDGRDISFAKESTDAVTELVRTLKNLDISPRKPKKDSD